MRAIHVCQRDDTSTGGAVRVAAEYVKRLGQFGIDARLLFLYGDRGFFGDQLVDRCDYLRLKNSGDIQHMPRLLKYLRQQQPNIVHHHDDMLWPQLLTLKHAGKHLSYKKIVHAHGGGTAKPQPLKTAWLYACQRFSVDAVVCITQEAKNSQQTNVGFAPEILHVISNGVDLNHYVPPSQDRKHEIRQSLGLPQTASVVGFVGRLHNVMKGADDFLNLIAALPPNYWGIVAGDGPDRSSLKHQAQTLGIIDRIVFTGLLNDPVMAYQAMDVFCMTSRHEPFGLTIIEAMACDLPVIGFRCPGGSQEILTAATGVMIDRRDIEQMANAVKLACQHEPPWSDRMMAARNLLATTYSWDMSAAKLADLYRSLI